MNGALCVPAEIDVTPATVTTRIVVPQTGVYLDGHFPGMVVFPGVFFVDALCDAVAAALGDTVELRALPSARFSAPVVAGAEFRMTLTIDTPDDDPITVRARCVRGDGRECARLSARFGRR